MFSPGRPRCHHLWLCRAGNHNQESVVFPSKIVESKLLLYQAKPEPSLNF